MIKKATCVFSGIVILVLTQFGCLTVSAAEPGSVIEHPVKIAPIKVDRVARRISTFGTLTPKTEELSFKIAGRIASFSVEEGMTVKAGQVLAKLETENAQDALKKQQVSLDQAKRNLERFEKLHTEGSIQKSQFEDAQDQFEQIKIAFEQAQTNLDHCLLTAPSDGIILKEYLESRTSVMAGTPIYAFQSSGEVWVTKVELTDKNAFILSEGTKAEVRFAPYPGVIFAGELTKLSGIANESDGLYTAEITITTQGHSLRPGMIAEVDLFHLSSDSYSIVPLDALVDARRGTGVIYLLGDDRKTAIEKSITIKSVVEGYVALMEDLSSFSHVIVRGQTNLQNMSAVNIID